jgi:hypothetical protein
MLRSAILFDASLTLREAVARLEQNSAWPSPDSPGAVAWLRRLEGMGVGREKALARLRGRVAHTWAAVRRQHFAAVLWYRYPLPEFFARLESWGGPDDAPLVHVLNLHETDSDPTVQAREDPTGEFPGFDGVVLDGVAFAGVAESLDLSRSLLFDGVGIVVGGERAVGSPPPAGAPPPPSVGAPPPPLPPPAPAGGGLRRGRGVPRMEEILGGTAGLGTGADAADEDAGAEEVPPDASPPEVASPAPRVLHAHPFLAAPDVVEAGEVFDVEIGLSPEAVAGVAGGEMRIARPAGEASFVLTLQLLADGFEAPRGWRHELVVRHASPFDARVKVPLMPLPPPPTDDPERTASLQVIRVEFIVDGARCGDAARNIVVIPKGAHLPAPHFLATPWAGPPEVPAVMTLAPSPAPVDLEVTLAKPDGNDATGRFLLTLRTPHDVALPDKPLVVDLGTDARSFAKSVIEEIRDYHGTKAVAQLLRSRGSIIADQLPQPFWDVLTAVADEVRAATPGRVPSLLFYSADPWVPWELAWMENPLDPERPRFLAAQTRMGRWIVGSGGRPAPPATSVDVRTMAAVAGMYQATGGFAPLPMAKAEVDELARLYKALPVPADLDGVLALLDAALERGAEKVGADAVHFAAHGQVDPSRPESAALFMSDGRPLKASFFRRSELGERHAPFLFLNACMVGTGGEVLGDADGFPGNCLRGGFRGLLAPLWAVDDAVAHDLALDFYRRAFGLGGAPEAVGSILHDVRRRYGRPSDPVVHTYMAYVYYGHPELTLKPAWEH